MADSEPRTNLSLKISAGTTKHEESVHNQFAYGTLSRLFVYQQQWLERLPTVSN